jgi:hypothetical protein
MKKIAKLLKADLNGTSDLSAIAAMLSSKGRGNDTLLAHITPREAEILKAAGGSGTTNPDTGLLEFYDGEGGDFSATPTSGEVAAQQFPDYGAPTPEATASLPFSTGPEPLTDTPTAPSSAAYAAPPASQYGITYGFQPTGGVGAQAQVPADFGPAVPPSLGLGYGVRDTVAPSAALETTPRPPEKSGFLDKLSTDQMLRLGLAGGLGLMGQQQAKKAAGQAQAASAEQKSLAQPYQQKGQELIRAAESGELTPTGQQSLQATQARIAQGVEARGGVGAQQAAAQVEAFRQQLLTQQYNYGLQIAQVGDSIALGAIKTGLQADQQVQQATGQFYTSLASIAAGLPLAQRTTA